MALDSISSSTCVDPILKVLEEDRWTMWAPEVYEQVELLKVKLRFLRTFLRYIAYRIGEGNVRQFRQFRPLVIDLAAVLKTAERDFTFAAAKLIYPRRATFVKPAISELQEKLDLFSPSIKEAYNDLTNNPFYSASSEINICLWKEFPEYLIQNLLDLCNGKVSLPVSVIEQLRVLAKNVRSLISFVHNMLSLGYIKEHALSVCLFTHFGSLVVHVAHLSYLCCFDELDEYAAQEMQIMLVNVQKEWPSRTEFMETRLKLIASSKSDVSVETDILVQDVINSLVPRKNQFEILLKGLKFLVKFFIDAQDSQEEDVKSVLKDITSVFANTISLSYIDEMTDNMSTEAYLELSLLFEKMELLKAEILIVELLKQKDGLGILLNDQIDSLNEGLSFLGSILPDPPKERTEAAKPIWMEIKAVVKEASFLNHSIQAKEITESLAVDGLVKLLDKIRLFKAEALLRKVLCSNHSLMIPPMKQIEILYGELIFFRTFLMSRLDEKGKLMLPHVESVAKEAETFYYSFRATEITEEVVMTMSLLVPSILKKTMVVKAELREIYLQIRRISLANFPKTNKWCILDFLLENLKEMLKHEIDAIAVAKHHFEFIHNEIEVFKSSLGDNVGHFSQHSKLKNLCSRIINVAYETELVTDSFMVKEGILWYHWLWLSDIIEEIKLIQIQVSEISKRKACDDGVNNDDQKETLRATIIPASYPAPRIDEVELDLPDQVELIIDRLQRGSLQQDIVAIVGMPGLGKTTLAKKVYNEPSIGYHFHVRAWCHVSQTYHKRKLLIDILSDINRERTQPFLEMNDEDLEFELYQCLKRRRYLIVMDDLWSLQAWSDLERSFPNDENGSRILITSRIHDLALKVKADCKPHALRLLSDAESWNLLQMKLFDAEDCPQELWKIGEQIAKNCRGLPLAVVAVAGLLGRTNKDEDWWNQVAGSLGSLIADDPQTRCMDILELSYKNLPEYLKPCFLYLGAFLDDKEILVWKLKCLWIAEGFVQNTVSENLEDVAEKYLMDLISKSLVMVAKRRSKGGVKTCQLHSMLRELCVARCKSENFSQLIKGYDEYFPSSEDLDYGVDYNYNNPSLSIIYEKHQLVIYSKRKHFVMARPSGPHVRSLLFFGMTDTYPRCPYDVSFISQNFILLRVLDLECINMGHSMPKGIEALVHLRYLALSGDIDSVPSSIANLWNLVTFIMRGLKGRVMLPDTIWEMTRLRHLHVNNHATFCLPNNKLGSSCLLDNLVTFSSPYLSYGNETEKILRRLPKLRKLNCIFSQSLDDARNSNGFPILDFLTDLESLKIFHSGRISYPSDFNFPLNLKKLTLSNFRLPWEHISEIGRLPNLEVLKLLSRAFEGKTWDMREGDFLELKFLKLENLDIAQWNASSDHLPKLERLVLQSCKQLEEVPLGFVDIPTLQMIEMKLCRHSAEESVRRLKEEQLEMGSDELKVLINL